MSDAFNLGEIAIAHAWDGVPHLNGTDVEVIEGLQYREGITHTKRRILQVLAYIVLDIDGKRWVAPPSRLRKKRPPQDWATLCNLTQRPRELETA